MPITPRQLQRHIETSPRAANHIEMMARARSVQAGVSPAAAYAAVEAAAAAAQPLATNHIAVSAAAKMMASMQPFFAQQLKAASWMASIQLPTTNHIASMAQHMSAVAARNSAATMLGAAMQPLVDMNERQELDRETGVALATSFGQQARATAEQRRISREVRELAIEQSQTLQQMREERKDADMATQKSSRKYFWLGVAVTLLIWLLSPVNPFQILATLLHH